MATNPEDKTKEMLSYAMHLCGRAEMCREDIREKLLRWNLEAEKIDQIIQILEKENFINEERYTGFFIRDKLKFNKWGKIKIRYSLKMKKIPESIINSGLDNIDEVEYLDFLRTELSKKPEFRSKKKNDIAKLVRFAQSRGFELDLILAVLKADPFED